MIPISDDAGTRHRFPFVMIGILLANVAMFAYELSLGDFGLQRFFLSAGVVPVEFTQGREIGPMPPYGVTWVTLLTSIFMHGGFLHIGSNMLYLWVFGDNIEDRFGHIPFLIFYLVCGLIASATHILFNVDSAIPTVGASGAIAGVLGAYLLLFPQASVRTLLILGPFISMTRVSALILIGFWFVTQFFSGIASLGAATDATGGVAVWAHIGGFVAGLLLAVPLRGRGRQPLAPWRE